MPSLYNKNFGNIGPPMLYWELLQPICIKIFGRILTVTTVVLGYSDRYDILVIVTRF